MKRKNIVFALAFAFICTIGSVSAYWGSAKKIAYVSGQNYGDKMKVASLPKKTKGTTALFDCGYRTSYTKPTVKLVNLSGEGRSNFATLSNGVVTAKNNTGTVNYNYNVLIKGAWNQVNTDTMTFRFNPN